MPIIDRRKDRFIVDQDTRVSVGIDFPFARVPSSGDGYFKTSKTTIDAIKNNIKLLLKTERGERLFQPFLGMDLKRFVFEQITEDIKIQIENDIVNVFETWLPFVNLGDIQITTDQDNKININIIFNIKRAPSSLESVGVVLE
jgi:phage baseplate assembly protein W|tara:strand:- start:102 stop:530 length:429 start_codon:yes stop_codon:yes gene_type:complete